jgi:anthranilate phosphoribosyltransferase
MIRQAINQLIEGRSLSAQEAEGVMDVVMTGEATPAQIAGFLVALRVKGETVDEITGCARAMRRAAVAVRPCAEHLVDTCGTGGDRAGTFNVSTTAAFVAAGAGLKVAKHGNRSVSSRSGSADVLEALGVYLDLTHDQVARCIDQVGIGFLFAPKFHPAMRYAIGPRRELGVRTIFNILGPLTNPAGASAQLLGVYDPALTETLARVLQELGSQAAFVVHGQGGNGGGGLDELTTIGSSQVSYFGVGAAAQDVVTETLVPNAYGFAAARLDQLKGGTPQDNARITRDILSGTDRGPRQDTVLLNAGAVLLVGGLAADLHEGIELARESIEKGEALEKLEAMVAFSQDVKT